MKSIFFKRAVEGALILTLLSILLDICVGDPFRSSALFYIIVSNLLVALVLGIVIVKSSFKSTKLAFIVFLIFFMIGHFNILIEALIFNVTDRTETTWQIIRGFIIAALFAPLYTWRMSDAQENLTISIGTHSFFGWTWRIVAGNILYLLFYLTAGMILYTTYPEISEFYADKVPPMATIIGTQIFLRGFIFIGVAILLHLTLGMSPFHTAVITGLLFSILGGIAPLIPPNELMPELVRLGHGIEVGISNFLYGFILSYLVRTKP